MNVEFCFIVLTKIFVIVNMVDFVHTGEGEKEKYLQT